MDSRRLATLELLKSLVPGDLIQYDFGAGLVIVMITSAYGDNQLKCCVGYILFTDDEDLELGASIGVLDICPWVRLT